MIEIERLFPHLNDPDHPFEHRQLFSSNGFPWEPLKKLKQYLQDTIESKRASAILLDTCPGLTITDGASGSDPGLFVNDWIVFKETTLFPSLQILISEGTKLEPSAIIKGPCVIGKNCDIRQGAYLRGNVLTGDQCTLGHATEIKNSILMNHTEAGHFNYIGDSILGSYVNLGAGSKLANLQFRTDEEKLGDFIHNIHLPMESGDIDTGLNKLGSIVGDHSELGCNAVLSPGTILGAQVWVYPNSTIPKGVYEPRQVLLPREMKPRSRQR